MKRFSKPQFALWVGLAVLILAVVLLAVLHSGPARRYAKLWGAEYAADLGVDLTVGDLDYNLLTGSVIVSDLRVRSFRAPERPALFEAARVELDLDLFSLFGSLPTLQTGRVEGASLRYVVDADGGSNLPETGADPSGSAGALPPFRIEALKVSGNELLIDDLQSDYLIRLPDWTLTVAGSAVGSAHAVRFEAVSPGVLALLERTLVLEELSFDGDLHQNRAEVRRLAIRAEGIEAILDGAVEDFGSPRMNLNLTASGDAATVASLAGLEDSYRGRVDVTARADGGLPGIVLSANVESADLTIGEIQNSQLAVAATWRAANESLTLTSVSLKSPQGNVSLNAEISTQADTGRSEVQGRVERLRLLALTRTLKLPTRIAGSATGTFSGEWNGLDFTTASGSGRLTLSQTLAVPQRDVLPVTGTLAFAARQGNATVSLSPVRTLGAEAEGEVRVQLGEGGGLEGAVSVRVNDLSRAAEQVRLFRGQTEEDSPVPEMTGAASLDARLSGTTDNPILEAELAAPSLTVGGLDGVGIAAAIGYNDQQVAIRSAVVDWSEQSLAAEGSLDLRGESPVVDLRTTATAVSIADVLRGLESTAPMEGQVNVAAELRGPTSDLTGTATIDGTGLAAFGETLGIFSGRIALADQVLNVADFRLQRNSGSDGSDELTGSGSYRLDSEEFTFNAAIQDWTVASLQVAETSIRGSLRGEIDGVGTPDALDVSGNLNAANLRVGEQFVGDVSADVETESGQVILDVTASRFGLVASGRIDLSEPHRIEGRLEATNTDLSLFGLKATTGEAFTGSLSAVVEGSGVPEDWENTEATARISQLEGAFRSKTIRVEDELQIAYADRTLRVQPGTILIDDSRLQLSGALPLDEGATPGALQVQGDLNLETLVGLIPSEHPTVAQGRLKLDMALKGSLRRVQPALSAEIAGAAFYTESLYSPFLETSASLRLAEGVLQLDRLTANWAGATISAQGDLPLGVFGAEALPFAIPDSEAPANLTVGLSGLVVDSLSQLPPDVGGTVSLRGEFTAPQPTIEALTGVVAFEDIRLSYKSFDITQKDPIRIALSNGRLHIEQFGLTGPQTEFTAEGEANLLDERELRVELRGRTGLGILALPLEDVSAAGETELALKVSGTLDAPEPTGTLTVRRGQLSVSDPDLSVANLNARVTFTQDRLKIEELAGDLNGGTIKGEGSVAYPGLEVTDVNLTLASRGVFLDYPAGLQTVSATDLQVQSGDGGLITVSGQARIQDGVYTEPIELDRFLLEYMRSGDTLSFVEQRDPLLSRVRFNVGINSEDPLIVDNNLAEMAVNVNVRLAGSYYQPGLVGRITLEEGGQLLLSENRYFVDRGTIDFGNQNRIEPNLDIVARTQVRRKYDIDLRLSGGGSQEVETTLSSSSHPELSEPDLISLLLTGRTREDLYGEEINAAAEQSLSYLTGRIGGSLARGAQKGLGLSEVRIEPNLIAAESDPGARLTIGQNITNDFGLVYSTNLADSSDQIWIAEYDITRRFRTQGIKQDDNSYRFEFRHDLRFGGPERVGRSKRQRQRIQSVDVSGGKSFDIERLLAESKLVAGKEYDFFRVRQAMGKVENRLARLNLLEADLRLDRETSDTGIDLAFRVDPGPQVTFSYEGFAVPDKLQNSVRRVWRDGFFDSQRLDRSVLELKTYLAKEGYLAAAVVHEIAMPDDQNKRVVFRIEPGVRYSDVAIEFQGNDGVESKELRAALAGMRTEIYTKPRDVTQVLSAVYRQRGYLDVRVTRPSLELDPTTKSGRVTIAVEEGPLFRLESVRFEGNKGIGEEVLREAAALPVDEAFRPELLRDAVGRVEERYWNEGYNDVVVNAEVKRGESNDRVNLAFSIKENDRGVVSEISVEGTGHTSDGLVRGQLGFKPGDTLDFDKVTRARRKLYDTGAYSLVDIETDPLDQRIQPGNKPVNLRVKVREVSPFQIRYGAFFDTDRGPGIIADFTNRNTLGSARVFGLRTRYDSDVREARTYFSQPLMRSFPLQTTATYFLRREIEPTFITDRQGVSVTQEMHWDRKYILTYGYRFENTHNFLREPDPFLPPEVTDVRFNIAPLNITFSRETRDQVLDASRGSFVSNAFEYAPSQLGSDLEFVRYFGQYFKYVPLAKPSEIPFAKGYKKPRVIYAGGVRVGLARGLAGQDVFRSERFFAGGGTTIRGFEQDTLGPMDFFGDPEGGNAILVVNNEIRFPMIGIFDGVGFMDIGNVYSSVSDFDLFDVRKTAGAGLRVRTPYFLIRADYGFKLDRRVGESRGAFFFSIGQAF